MARGLALRGEPGAGLHIGAWHEALLAGGEGRVLGAWRVAGVAGFEEARFVLSVVKALRLAKRLYSYRELSLATGVSAPRLSRYVSGRGLPSPSTAKRLLAGLERLADPRRRLAESIAEKGGVIDTGVVLSDPLYLHMATMMFASRFRGVGVTRILVPEASGIPLAASLSLELEVPFTVARRREVFVGDGFCSSIEPVFCIPRGVIGRSDRVLVVDDIVETGKTLRALREIVEASGARLVGVAALVAVGEEWAETSGVREVYSLLALRKRGVQASIRVPGY